MTKNSYIMLVACLPICLPKCWLAQYLLAAWEFVENRHRLCLDRRVPKARTERIRKSDIEFLWIQLEEVIEHGKNKDAKTKLELLQRIYQVLAKTMRKNK
jgi:hypothetical protein